MWCSFIRGRDSLVCCLDKGYLKMVFQVAFNLYSVTQSVMQGIRLIKGYLKKQESIFQVAFIWRMHQPIRLKFRGRSPSFGSRAHRLRGWWARES